MDNSISIVLPVLKDTLDDLTDNQRKVYEVIGNQSLSSSQIAKATGFGSTKVRQLLKILMELNYVGKIGNGRSTRYICL